MKNKIKIISKNFEFLVELNDSKTSQEILKKLPIVSRANRWGNEIYFQIPVYSELENGIEILDIGSVAYWPPGNAFCIFFGKTPASTKDKPQAASPVTVIGKIIDNKSLPDLKKISDGDIEEKIIMNNYRLINSLNS
ncbi:MAG: hypothetical protein KJ821_03560 [Actinobacteria bacterium]|nr:hypothetical protein [Actinomycetota bacterium]MBU4483508.1 hypothetical protein [Actinomycetota bacterium]MCG2791245.1 hypothetical protein [Actinomycetes bacterium]